MATQQEIQAWFRANPGATDAQIFAAMQQFGVTPGQVSSATGADSQAVQDRYNAQQAAFAEANQMGMLPMRPSVSAPAPTVSIPQSSGSSNNVGDVLDILGRLQKGVDLATTATTPSPVLSVAAGDSAGGGLLSSANSALGSVLTPLSIGNFINNYFSSRRDERKAEAAKQMAKAQAGLQAAGVDPFAIYAPDVINQKLQTTEGLQELAGVYPGNLMQDLEAGKSAQDIGTELAFGVFSDYLNNPDKYPSKVSEQATSATGGKSPTQYKEIPTAEGEGQSRDVVEGSFVQDGTLWNYDAMGRKWKVSEPDVVSLNTGGGGGSAGASDGEIGSLEPDPELMGGTMPDTGGGTVVGTMPQPGADGKPDPTKPPVADEPVTRSREEWLRVVTDWLKKYPNATAAEKAAATAQYGVPSDVIAQAEAAIGTGPGGQGGGSGGVTGTPTVTPVPTPPGGTGVVPTPSPTPTGEGTGTGTGTGPGEGPGTGGGKSGGQGGLLFGANQRRTSELLFPEIYKNEQKFTLLGNLLSYRPRGMF